MQQRDDIKVHAKNSGNQIQRQKNSREGREHSHRFIRPIALRVKVNLHGCFDALL